MADTNFVAMTFSATVLGAIAAAINLLVPVSVIPVIILVGAAIVALQLWGSYKIIVGSFKWLSLALLAYLGAALFAHPNWGEVLRATFVPRLSFEPQYIAALVAIFGTTISPHMFFWQHITSSELKAARWDTRIGMFFSNVIMYFIILATGATLYQVGQTHITAAADAAEALRPLAGDGAAVADTFGWKSSLNSKPGDARSFYAVIVAGTAFGVSFNFLGINPIDALFWTAVLNGFLAPPLLVLIMLVANNRTVMGSRANGRALNLVGWATTAGMFATALALVKTWTQ